MPTEKFYIVISNWVKKKNFKNFCQVYKYGFTYKHLWNRPLWRVWRIIRNTWINKNYQIIYNEYKYN